MIIVLKPNQKQEVIDSFVQKLTHNYDVQVNTWVGTQSTVLGLIGDTTAIDAEYIQAQDFVESVKRVQEPYKKANRKFTPTTRSSPCPAARRSRGGLALIAGPLLGGERGADLLCGRKGEGVRGPIPPGRGLQAPTPPTPSRA